MQSKAQVLNRIKSTGVVAVIRAERPDDLIDVSRAWFRRRLLRRNHPHRAGRNSSHRKGVIGPRR